MQSPPSILLPAAGRLIRRRRPSHSLPRPLSVVRHFRCDVTLHQHLGHPRCQMPLSHLLTPSFSRGLTLSRESPLGAVTSRTPSSSRRLAHSPQVSIPHSSHESQRTASGCAVTLISVARSPAVSGDSSPPSPGCSFHSRIPENAPLTPAALTEKLHSRLFTPKYKKRKPDLLRDQALKNPAACYSPTSEPGSTLADEALHFRVRNGNGCYILSMATGKAIERFWSEKRTSTCGCFASFYEVITASL